VKFSVGRDIRLDPPQQGEPLNYFVYPYAEVDGKPLASKFSFLDSGAGSNCNHMGEACNASPAGDL